MDRILELIITIFIFGLFALTFYNINSLTKCVNELEKEKKGA